jgi:putative hydrolase of the HAD superfamily
MREHEARGSGPVRDVFLDFGGTLVASLGDAQAVFEAAATRAGIRLDWPTFLRVNDALWEELFPTAPGFLGRKPSFADMIHQRAALAAGASGSVEEFVAAIREEILSPKWHAPFPETEPVLRQLRAQGRRLHVVSNNVDYLPLVLQNLGLARLFDSVTFSQEVGAAKPDPRIFALAVARAGCAPSSGLFVGDSWEADYLGAQRSGLRAVWLNRRGAEAPAPCQVIRDLGALPELLAGGL